MKAAFLAVAVFAAAGVVFHFSTAVHAAKAGRPASAEHEYAGQAPAVHKALPSKSLSLPLFFEPNQGQTAPQVKFLARGAGYNLFLTADEAVLDLQRMPPNPRTATANPEPKASSVIRMHLEGANSSARVSGASPLPGKSSYFIGRDPSKWHHDIPQFGRVEYKSVYPGVDLVYYGDQRQLEYDFRVMPAADPSQIALSFKGASAHIESGDSGDLVLSTANGEVRLHAPRIYQQDEKVRKPIAGSFRQIAENKIGFTVADYDHTRELVIDPVLTYSTYLGGSDTEGLVKVAVNGGGGDGNIYLAGSTNSTDFPVTDGSTRKGAQNIFISKLTPQNAGTGKSQLVYSIYLGGSQVDSLAGIAVDSNSNIYVAGSTTSSDFPTLNGLPFTVTGGTQHGFVSAITFNAQTVVYSLTYSTYLAGNGVDTVTGLAIDGTGNAFVTGITTSTNGVSNGFPANDIAFQPASHAPSQFFASKIYTKSSGAQSMIYSTYLGGGNPQSGQTQGGGIAVDTAGNMYITGATNFLPVDGPNQGEVRFPLNLAYQSCLDQASKTSSCSSNPTALDAFVAKITPTAGFTLPIYCTYLGGSGDDIGFGIAVDSSNNAYVTGSTTSPDWVSPGTGFQTAYGGGGDAFIAKIGSLTGSSYPLNYFTYLGGSGSDVGQAIQVDPVQAAHVAGSTNSPDLILTPNALQSYGGGGDAFLAVISTTLSGRGAGDLLTYFGGSQQDQGSGVAVDIFGATYLAGTTQSSQSSSVPFPITSTAYQKQLNGPQDAFVSQIGAKSTLTLAPSPTSPSPNPVAAGTQVAFTFNITNTGPDNASQVLFTAVNLPTTGLASTPTAKVTSGSGSCSPAQGSTIPCFISTLAAGAVATVEVDVTPAITTTATQIQISGTVTANNSGITVVCSPAQPPANIVDFTITASTSTPTINAGDTATFQVVFKPTSNLGYNATITPSQTTSPSMVTATTPTFNPTTINLSGGGSATTTLSIATVPRPVITGILLRRGSFYATWLPIGGLSLVGLGIGAGRKRRRWLAAAVLCLIAGAILLQSGCGSSSSSAPPSGGTQAGVYNITITGSAGTGASHNTVVTLTVR